MEMDKIAQPGMKPQDFPKDLTGWTFGRLTVLYLGADKVKANGRHLRTWTCHCECGNVADIPREYLVGYDTKSCGCWKKIAPSLRFSIDLRGRKFGRLTCISRALSNQKNVKWHCSCTCGNYVMVSTNSLTSGNTKSCGCKRAEVSRGLATTINGGVFHPCQYTKARLKELYLQMTPAQIALLAQESHDDPSITENIVRGWLKHYRIEMRSLSAAKCHTYRTKPNYARSVLTKANIAFKKKVESGEYYSPTLFNVNPEHLCKTKALSNAARSMKAKARRAQAARERMEQAEMERLLNGDETLASPAQYERRFLSRR